ncbi:MAG: nitroreductase family protein [Promethearchaeota archaeon]
MIDPKTFLNFLKSRRSIRNFEGRKIEDEHLKMILEAGRWAPSASNRQPWQFIIIKNKDILEKISKEAVYGSFLRKAPLAIAIVGKISENPNWYIQDTSLASMNMMLMAWSLGIGSCWIGTMNREKVKQILGLTEDDFLLTVLPFGYIKGRIPNPPPRKNLAEITRELI